MESGMHMLRYPGIWSHIFKVRQLVSPIYTLMPRVLGNSLECLNFLQPLLCDVWFD